MTIDIQKYQNIIIAGAVLLIIIFINMALGTYIDKSAKETSAVAKEIVVKADPPKEERAIKSSISFAPAPPDDPTKYAAIPYSADNQPRTQVQWDVFIDRALTQTRALDQPQAKPALDKMKKTPEEFKARMKQLDERIALFEKRKHADPSDTKAEEHLQVLYMLKAVSKTLENKVVKP